MNTLPTVDIKGKQYVLVKDRILAFHELYTNGAISTSIIVSNDTKVEFLATVMPDASNPARHFTGHSQATWGDGYINKTSALENAETSAVGRALAFLGIGVLESIASADEIKKTTHEEVESLFNPPQNDSQKQCPICKKLHTGKFPKCIDCWKAENPR